MYNYVQKLPNPLLLNNSNINLEAPLNDLCTDAVPIYLGSTYKGTNVGATLDFPTGPAHACVNPYYTGLVWYRVVGIGAIIILS